MMKEAFRMRKAWGGGMRQIWILAAAGQYAIENNFDRLSEDHENAKVLANSLSQIEGVEIDLSLIQTNMLMFKPTKMSVEDVIEKSKEKGLLISTGAVGYLRAVTHMDVSSDDINKASQILLKILA